MIKVVEVISDTNIGGAGVLLLNRLKNTDKGVFDTTVIVPNGSQLMTRFLEIGAKVITMNGGRDRSFDIKSLKSCCNIIDTISPDIVNAHGSLSSRIAAKKCRVPVRIYTRHCVYPLNQIYKSACVRSVFGKTSEILSDSIIAVAHSAKEDLVRMGAPEDKIRVIINGAEPLKKTSIHEQKELKSKLGIDEGKTVVCICARLEPCKDHECFLRAARILCDILDDYRFLIIGKGSLENELRKRSKELELEGKVIFTGFVKNVAPFMSISDINVNCSIGTETSSLALSEGMSIGLPCVVSDYGGNPYMVRNGENGYVYTAGDHFDLARKIIRSKNNFLELSKGSIKRFSEELNAKKMTEETQNLYLELYKEKKRNF